MVDTRGESAHSSDIACELPGYRIMRQLGRGSMGVVYLAEDLHLRRHVALKVLAPTVVDSQLFRTRFNRESHNAATLDHPNIIPIYAAGQAAGVLYIAMRYVAGGDLRALLETNGPLSLEQASAVIVAMADALDAAHTQGIIHRDVKPANILIDNRNGQHHYYLSDFGIAKITSTGESLTSTGQILGTIDYIAPEQVQGKPIDNRADLYALGCVLYYCLTGTVPFPRADIAALMWAHVYETPPPVTAQRPDLPPQIDRIVAKAMAKQPADRYPTGRELAAALHALTAEPATSNNNGRTFSTAPPVSASMTSTYIPLTPAPTRAPVTTTRPRHKWWLAACSVLALVLIASAVSGLVIWKRAADRKPATSAHAASPPSPLIAAPFSAPTSLSSSPAPVPRSPSPSADRAAPPPAPPQALAAPKLSLAPILPPAKTLPAPAPVAGPSSTPQPTSEARPPDLPPDPAPTTSTTQQASPSLSPPSESDSSAPSIRNLYLHNLSSNLCLTTLNNSEQYSVRQAECNKHDTNQLWDFIEFTFPSGKFIQIRKANSGLCIAGHGTNNGSSVAMTKCDSKPDQYWELGSLYRIGSFGYRQFGKANSELCLATKNDEAKSQVVQSTCSSDVGQYWNLRFTP